MSEGFNAFLKIEDMKFKKIFIINFNFILYSTFYYFNILPKVDYLFHFNDSIDDQIGYAFSDS